MPTTTKKKKTKLLTEKNALVKELKEVEWIKNPFIYSQIRGDFSLMQTQIMLSIVGRIQDQINEHINGKKVGQLELPFAGEAREGEVEFVIKLSDLDVRKDMYDELEVASKKLLDMKVTYNRITEDGKEYAVFANMFSRIEIPKTYTKADNTEIQFKNGQRREGSLKIYMIKNNFKEVFDMRKGYVEHVNRIVPLCRKKRTPRLYIYLSRWKDVGHKTVDYNELKEFLGVLTWDEKRKNIREDQYKLYSLFSSKVLDPVKKEMDALSTMNQIDFTFEYAPKYSNGKTRGNPDGITFTIHLSDIGKQRKNKSMNDRTLNSSQQLLREEYGLTDSDIFGLYNGLSPEMIPLVNAEVYNLRERVQNIAMKNPKLYVLQSMRNYIESIRPVADEIPNLMDGQSTNDEQEGQTLSESDQQLWEGFIRLVKDTVDVTEIETYWNFVSAKTITENDVTIQVPTKFVAEHIYAELRTRLNVAFSSVFGEGVSVHFDIEQKY